ncbi:uncharacterized protein V1513DRAFT_254089 [Lipomyces chichibuensis]|uniref:uncharacterized protein n=1 Tax=Lipomyces chichibuensis TaxID=1546026 RepID=UPI00334429AA
MGATPAPLPRPVLHSHDHDSTRTTTAELVASPLTCQQRASPDSPYHLYQTTSSSGSHPSKASLSSSSQHITRLPPIRCWSESESESDLSDVSPDLEFASSVNMQTDSRDGSRGTSPPSHQPQHQRQQSPPLQPVRRPVSRSPPSAHNSAKITQRQSRSQTTNDSLAASTSPLQMPTDSSSEHPPPIESIGQVCSNCGTTRTPLWRRAPDGTTICNACGLYLKARNISRPVNLKRPPQSAAISITGASVAAADVDAAVNLFITADHGVPGTCPGDGHCNGTGGARACSGCPAYNNRVAKAAQIASTIQQQRRHQLQQHEDPRFQPTTGETDGSRRESYEQPPYQLSSQQSQQHTVSIPSNYQVNNLANPAVIISCQNCGTTITPLWRRDEVGHTICNACGT